MHGTGDYFLNISLVAQTLKTTINKWELLKLKSFFKAKDTVNKTEQQTTEWENMLTNSTSDKVLTFKMCRELKKLNIKIPNNPT